MKYKLLFIFVMSILLIGIISASGTLGRIDINPIGIKPLPINITPVIPPMKIQNISMDFYNMLSSHDKQTFADANKYRIVFYGNQTLVNAIKNKPTPDFSSVNSLSCSNVMSRVFTKEQIIKYDDYKLRKI